MWMVFVAAGLEPRDDQIFADLNSLVPINSRGEFRWYSGYCFSRDWDPGTLTIAQQAFAPKTAAKSDVRSTGKNPLWAGVKLEEFEKNEAVGDWMFRELVGCLMWLANQTRSDIANAVRAVARYTTRPREPRWRTAVGSLEYVCSTSDFGIAFRKGSGLELVAFADADYANKAAGRRSVQHGAVICAGAGVLVQYYAEIRPSTTEA